MTRLNVSVESLHPIKPPHYYYRENNWTLFAARKISDPNAYFWTSILLTFGNYVKGNINFYHVSSNSITQLIAPVLVMTCYSVDLPQLNNYFLLM